MAKKKLTKSQRLAVRQQLYLWKKASKLYNKARTGFRNTKPMGAAQKRHSKMMDITRKKILSINKKIKKFGFKNVSQAKSYLKRTR